MTSMTGMRPNVPMAGPTGKTGNKIPSGYRSGQLQQFTPEMMQLFQQMFSHAGPDSYLSKLAGGDQSMFEEIEQPAHRQFSASLGNIASRFSGQGSFGNRRSSGFQNTATAAASNFAEQLQSQRQGLQRQAILDLKGLSESLLGQRPYEQFVTPKKKSFWQELLLEATPGITEALSNQFSGKTAIPGLG